ncbi:RHS repeat-associated core domain-containing protein [Pseudomonas sp. SIMBA_077]
MQLMRYAYDPLDRLIATLPGSQDSPGQLFYNHERLSTRVQGQHSQSVIQHQHLVLAEKRTTGTQLLATDAQRSVVHALSSSGHHAQAYSVYGHPRIQSGQQRLLGFNGEAPDPLTGHYLLGNGHRGYNPVLMRFNSPDALSPFGKGGINTYAYCSGDPVNRSDPSGRVWGINWKTFTSGIIGWLSVGVSAMPAVGFRESFVAIKSGTPTLTHVVKVSSTTAAFISAGASTVRGALINPDDALGESLYWLSTATSAASLTGNALLAVHDFLKRTDVRNTNSVVDSARVTNSGLMPGRESYELNTVEMADNPVRITAHSRRRSPSPPSQSRQDAKSIRNAP